MMRAAWLVLLLGACGSKKDEPPKPLVFSKDLPPEAPTDAQPLAIDPSLPPAGPSKPPDPLAPGAPVRPPVTIAGQCLDESRSLALSNEGNVLKLCVDKDDDGAFDRCATWNRTTGVLYDLADADGEKRTIEPLFSEATADDDRLTNDDPSIEVCPPDRICMKLMPKLPVDGEISALAADASYRTLAIALRESSEESGYIELWDLLAGRLRTKVKFRKLEADTTYAFNAHFTSNGSLIAIAERSDNNNGQGLITGPDGSVRGELANGTRFLDTSSIYEITPGTLAILDLEAPGVPYAVYTQSIATGRTLRKFTIGMDMDGDDDDSHMHVISPTLIGVTQWSTELRLDLIDLATGKQTTFRVPAC